MAHDLPTLERERLYEADYFAWVQAQVDALRARGAGANAIDYDNLAEEVDDLGKSLKRACRSHLRLIVEHLLKLEFAEAPLDRPHWRGEVFTFREQLNADLTPSLINELKPELTRIFEMALKDLLFKQYPIDRASVMRERPDGYRWDQIVDPSWMPRV